MLPGVRHVAVLGLAWTSAANIYKVVNAGCASGESTLTTEGCSACGQFDLCRGFTIASGCVGPDCKTDANCTFQCLSVNADSNTLTVLVEFGAYKSQQEVAAGGYSASDLTGYPDETNEWPSVSNDLVDTLGMIELSSQVSTFIVSGGTAVAEHPKGKVSRISLTSTFVSLATDVTKVVLQNLDLGNQINLLPDYLPASVKTIDLSNTLLTSFPTDLRDMPSLQRILLDYNYLTAVRVGDVINSTTTLSLDSNNIDTFDGIFPELEYLHLGRNNLTSIPTVIYNHPKLKTLNLTGNTFSSRYFTSEQVKFLKKLDKLGLSESDFPVGVGCDDSDQSLVNGVTICIKDGESTSTVGDDSDSSRANASDASRSPRVESNLSDRALTRVVLGTIYGFTVVVLFGVFMISRKFWVQRNNVENTTKYSDGNPSPTRTEYDQQQVKKLPPGRVRGYTRYSSNISMGIPTSPCEDDDSIDIPVLEAYSNSAAKHPLSIWNDYELLSLQLRASSIKDVRPLGSGGFAMVWLVRYRNTHLLAAKRLRLDRCTKKNIGAFVEEIKLVANFDHPDIVKFIGAAWTKETDLQMILEYMDGGDLRHYLSDAHTPTGWTSQKFSIAISVIEALVYLHSFVPPLLHRDLKSKNVLLSSDLKAKLSDFGKSRFLSDNNTMSGGVGTSRWLAPEVIRGDTDYDRSADIYSFGVLLTELDTNKVPYSSTRGPNGKVLSDTAIMHRVATGKLHPKLRRTCEQALKELVDRCLVPDPSKRPNAPEIANELRVIQQKMAATLSKRAPWTTDFIGSGAKYSR